MAKGIAVPYRTNPRFAEDEIARPFVQVRLGFDNYETEELALLDSGADICVLPQRVGVNLGARWQEQPEVLGLSGLTETLESRSISLNLTVGTLPGIKVPFAWTTSNDLPVILGQVDFFSHFDVCFFRSRGEIALRLTH